MVAFCGRMLGHRKHLGGNLPGMQMVLLHDLTRTVPVRQVFSHQRRSHFHGDYDLWRKFVKLR